MTVSDGDKGGYLQPTHEKKKKAPEGNKPRGMEENIRQYFGY